MPLPIRPAFKHFSPDKLINNSLRTSWEVRQSVIDALLRAGILRYPLPEYIAFAHPILQDYFAAMSIVGIPESEQTAFILASDHRWRDPIALFLQMNTSYQTAENMLILMSSIADVHIRIAAARMLGEIGDPRFDSAHLIPQWLLVAGGNEITLGDDEFDPDRIKHKIALKDYRIARFPIINAQYLKFADATSHQRPRTWHNGKYPIGLANYPVTYVSWNDAQAYCNWLTEVMRKSGEISDDLVVRLPSEAEWERAARGFDEQSYPWGNTWNAEMCNSSEIKLRNPNPVGIFPSGASPIGAEEMAGNVFEWTNSVWGQEWSFSDFSYPYTSSDGREDSAVLGNRVLRGGSWYHDRTYTQCSYRHRALPGKATFAYGFRPVIAQPLPNATEIAAEAEYKSLLEEAESLLSQGKAQEAGRSLSEIWKRGRLDAHGWNVLLTHCEQVANYQQLFSLFEDHLLGIRDSRILTLLAYSLRQAGNYAAAIRWASAAIDVAGSLSWPSQTKRNWAECVSENDATAASLYSLLLRYRLSEEEIWWALSWAEPVHHAQNRSSTSHIFLGDLYRSIKKYEDAATEYTQALEMPNNFWKLAGYYGRALIYHQLNREEEEVADFLALRALASDLLHPIAQNYHVLYYQAFAEISLAQKSIAQWSDAYTAVRNARIMVVLQEIAKRKTGRDGISQSFLHCHSEQFCDEYHLVSSLSFFHSLYLSFSYHVHDLISL